MKYSNTVEYNIKTSLDSKGLTQLKSELQGLELKLQNMGNKGFLDEKTFVEARNQIQGLGQALTDAFNPSLGMLDLSKLNQELKNNDVTAQGLKTAFSSLGAEGQVAFNNLVGELGKLDTGILRTNSQIDKLFTTFSNTFRWGLVSSFFSQFMNAIHSSVDYVKELDDSLTQIMLVTDYNRDSMNQFAKSANEAAKAVSMTTTGMTNASLIFAQQGYDLGQSQELATLSAKLANASQQDTATTSDQITAYMNAYGLQDSMEELTQQMDNWAKIANVSAADVGELAQASQRAASMANTVGVSGEALAAQIATIESVTREAPEQIGNGLKTLYARFSDISGGGKDEDGVDLGKVTAQLDAIGVKVLDQFGNIRTMDNIMEDLMDVWADLDDTAKIAAAQSLAGKYQVNRFVALMDNRDMYEEYIGATGSSATGTLDQMNEEFADSIEGRSAKLQASLEGLFSTIFNTDDIYPWMDAAQGAIDLLQQFFDALGGGKTVLLGISSLLMQVFSKNMAQEINNAVTNRAVQQQKLENLQNSGAALSNLGLINPNPEDQNAQNILDFSRYMNEQALAGNFNPEQMNQANNILAEMVQNSNAATIAADELKNNLSTIGTAIAAISGDNTLPPFLDEQGAVNASELMKILQQMDNIQIRDFFSDLEDKIGPVKKDLLDFNSAIQNYQKELNNADSTSESFEAAINEMKAALDRLQGELDVDTYNRYEEALDEISNKATDAKGDTSKLAIETAKLAEELSKVSEKDLKNLDHLDRQAFKVKTAGSAAEDSGKVAGAFKEGMNSQNQIKEVLDTLNAVQQLTFAWQAFQNLGSLWANEDLSIGEKVFQTIINLTMAMPQLISAIESLKNSGGIFETLNQGIKDFTVEGDFFAGLKEKAALDERSIQAEEKIAQLMEEKEKISQLINNSKQQELSLQKHLGELEITTGKNAKERHQIAQDISKVKQKINEQEGITNVLQESQKANAIAIDGAVAAEEGIRKIITAELIKQVALQAALTFGIPLLLGGLAAIVGYYQQQREEAEKLRQERLEASNQQTDELKRNAQNIQELYNNYKKTGEAADGLKEALEQQAEALGIVVTAADDYDSLKKKIDEATASQLAYNAALRGEDTSATKMTATEAGLTFEDKKALGIDTTAATYQNTANGQMQYQADGSVSADIAKTVEKSKELIDLEQQSIANRNAELAILDRGNPKEEEKYQLLKQQNAESQSRIDRFTNYVEGNKDYLDDQYAQAENSVLATALGSDIFKVTENAKGEFNPTSYQEALQYVKNITEELNLTEEQQQQLAATALEYAGNLEGAAQAQLAIAQNQIEQNPYVYSGIRAGESGMNKINDLSEQFNLSDQDKAKISDLIDWSDTDELDARVADLAKEIQEGLEEGLSLDDILSKMQEDQKIELTDDEILKQERDNKGYVGEDWERDTEGVKEYADSLQDLAEVSDDIADSLKDNRKEALKIADANARLNKGVKSLADSWDDWNKIISDTSEGIEATEDYSDAIHGVEDALTNIFDFDVSTGLADSTQFIKDHMDDIAAAAEGDMDAIERLRVAAAQQILIDADFDWDNLNVSQQELFNLISELNSESVEVGATLDTTQFGQQLADIVNAMNMSTTEMQHTLDSLGWEPDITYKEMSLSDFANQTQYTRGEIVGPDGEVKEVNLENTSNFNADDIVRVPILNASGTTYQGSAPKISSPSNHGGGGGGGGGGRGCFIAGTPITTQTAFKPIEQIQKGDIVLSYNEKLKINEYSEVVQTMIHNLVEPIYTLYIKDEQLRVTGIHRFLITNKITCGITKWVPAAELKVGDWVLFADGTWHVIWKIEVNIEQQTVYNFEVSGNHNYYVGHNQILAHNKGGSGKKGGGGGKAKEIKSKEKREHEKDYYEEVNSQLDKTEKILSKIEKEEDRLIGDKARANQNKQLKLLQKEIDLNEKKLKIQKRELKDVDALIKKEDKRAEKAALNAGVRANIPGVVLDEDGVVSNYEQISKAIDKTYNDLVKKYNEAAKKGNEKLAEKIEKQMSEFDDYSKNLLEQIKRHNKLQGEIVETEDDLESLADTMEDISIDAYKASQEAVDNLKEIRESAAELDKLFRNFDDSSFMNKFSIDDTPYGDLIEDLSKLDNIYSVTKEDANAFYQDLINQKEEALKNTKDEDEKKAIQKSIDFFTEQQGNLKDGANLDNGLLGLAQQDLARLQGWIDNPKAKDNIYGDNEAALFEAYQEAYERTLGLFKDYRELVQSTRDDILDIYSDAEEAIERQIDQFDRLSEKMERISDTYTLYYGEDSYDQLNQFYAQQGNIMQNQLNQLTAAYDLWKTRYEQAVKTGDEEIIKKTKDLMDEAEDAMLDAAEELAELWVKKFENAVEASSQHIYKDLFGSNDIDELTDNWELQKDYMDRYKDDVEKAYEVDKLRNKYLDLLDDAQGSSVQTQNRIRQQMQEQLDLLNGQATVSEYDVKLANAKLEILQKQIALEDAQRNKNKMQLRRDTQGNYRYVYTADQGDVREAQQDLADSEYDAYEMTKEETVANNDRAINLLQDYVEKRAAIWNKYKDDATALGINLANLEAGYGDSFKALAEDFTNTSAGMYDVLNWLVKNGSEDTTTAALSMLDALYDKNGEVKDKTGQDWMDMANLMVDQVIPNIESAVTKANLELENQAIELKNSMVGPDGALTKIGSGADDVADSMDNAAESTRSLATATSQLFTSLGADNAELDRALKKLAEYEEQLKQTQQTTSNLSKQLNTANKTIAAKNAEALNYKTILDYQSGAKKFKVGQVVTLKKGTWVSYHRDGDQYDANGDNGFRLSKDTQVKISHVNEHHTNGYGDTSQLAKYNIGFYEVGKEATKETGTGMANKSDTKKTERWHLNEDMLRQALTYDTGGYTGEWSNDESNLSKNGKLAVLHQKELVLNATDTENILAAITLMRDITQSTMGGLTNIGKVFSTNFSSAFNSTTEQRVEIQASFPNATDAEDIRAALLDLSDKAYQYANRTI